MFSSSSFSSKYFAVNTASPNPLHTLTYVSSAFSFGSSGSDRKEQHLAAHKLNLPNTTKATFEVWSLSPVLKNGWSLLGDVSKWVPVASQRFQQITEISSRKRSNDASVHLQLSAKILGSPGETITVYAAYLENDQMDFESEEISKASPLLFSATCVLPESGSSRILFPQQTCIDI
mmetsp:Transcript_25004/g.34894  ORF Transcript_25004/g.34894 Transcript_25004/m.34894 type:complete len:176 (-) Transcript_25004:349-876(-)